jgi:hypothetical protein
MGEVKGNVTRTSCECRRKIMSCNHTANGQLVHEVCSPLAALRKLLRGSGPLVAFHEPGLVLIKDLIATFDTVEPQAHHGSPGDRADIDNEPASLGVVEINRSLAVNAIFTDIHHPVTSVSVSVNDTEGLVGNWDSDGVEV